MNLNFQQTLAELKPSSSQAMAAARTLIHWTGDNPDSESLRDTPTCVVAACQEFFLGDHESPAALVDTTFEDVAGWLHGSAQGHPPPTATPAPNRSDPEQGECCQSPRESHPLKEPH